MNVSWNSQLLGISALSWAIGSASLTGQDTETPSEDSPPVTWSETDTRLANHYIQLLQKDPAYGSVLNLLWDLYRKKNQTDLLLDYFAKASDAGPGVATLIHAHLLRKNEQWDEARVAYDTYFDRNPESRHALEALAQIADRQKRYPRALSLYNRLAELVPVTEDEGIALRLRKAALHREQGQKDLAVETWNEVLEAHPLRVDLRTQIVAQLLEAGETKGALEALQSLAQSSDPRQRLEALIDLARLHEFLSDFDSAAAAAREGMKLLHFKTNQYRSLFEQLVQLHERFDRLPELENTLVTAADSENPSERALFDLADFYHLTADPLDEESAVARLVSALPDEVDYRIRLTNIRMQNDRYDAAAETLEEIFSERSEVPLRLVLLRARISLAAEDRQTAEEVIEDYLSSRETNADEMGVIIDFARENYLDHLVERLLRETHERQLLGREGITAPTQLARFLHERGRSDQALETLEQFVVSAGDVTRERARRLHLIAGTLTELGENDRALAAIDEAIELTPDNVDFQTARADLLIDGDDFEGAIAQLEALWARQETYDDRSDIDQRLFSLMRGHFSSEPAVVPDLNILQNGVIQSNAQYRKLAAAASAATRASDEPPPRELLDYYGKIKRTANESRTPENRYRAAWWAFKLLDNQECFQQLTRANEEAGKPILEIEKMLLELAVLNERPTLMVRHLTTLAEIDPGSADEYLQRRAEMRFELGFEDEAVRELKRLAAKPDASLNTLATLAKVYQRQGSTKKQVEVWEQAYREANIYEKRRIVKQLSMALIENGDPNGALEAQLELIEKESDLVQKQKQLDTQLTVARSHFLLDWLLGKYRDLAQQRPFDRFYPEAIARIQQASGNDGEAFEAMKKAYYLSGRSDALLDELGTLADRLGDLRSAIYYRRQLLVRDDGGTAENWATLVDMLERDLRVGEADLIRRRLESRFGRDPDFLEELTDHYLRNGEKADAERTLEKLVELRNWDLVATFQLGLLKRTRGKTEEALELFEEVLAETEDVVYPAELIARVLPLIRTSTLPEEDRESSGHELDRFIFTVEGYPFLGGSLQDEIAEALQNDHPEHHHFPKADTPILRLRALEEAASLVAENGTAPAWLATYAASEQPLHEQLWARRFAEDRTGFAALLDKLPEPVSDYEKLFHIYCRLLAGDIEGVRRWIEPEVDRDAGQQPRSRYASMACLLLLKDVPTDPLLDPEVIFEVLAELPVHRTVATHLFSELREDEALETAYRVGEVLANEILADDGTFLFSLSQVAGWTGRPAERIAFLDRAVATVKPGARGVEHLLAALTERLGLLSSDEEKTRYLAEAEARLATGISVHPSDRQERSLLVSLAGHRYPESIEKLTDIFHRQVQFLRPQSSDEDRVRSQQVEGWERMRRLLEFYSERIPMVQETAAPFLRATGIEPSIPPQDPSVLAEYEQFRIDRLMQKLEAIPSREREAAVEELHRLLSDPDSYLALARTLEGRGFHREAIPIYRIEAERKNRDYAPLQGLFEACNEALEPGPALEVINQIHAREFPTPPGLTALYLAEQHARFLLLSRDIERLVPLSRVPTAGDGAPPIASRSHVPYQAALVEAYRLMGRNDALLRLLRHLENANELEPRQALLATRILEQEERFEEALSWNEGIALDEAETTVRREALIDALRLHDKLG
ncbi:MAG: tetratricopeptide repeat protein, partial [Verrucomicrobiota bacterium]